MTKPHIHHAVPKNLLNDYSTGFLHNSALQSGLFFSAAAHIFLVLVVGFVVPQVFGTKWIDNTLDVVIVNQSNNILNEEATLSAQSNNEGGGSAEKEAETNAPWKAVNPNEVEQLAINTSSELTVEEVSETFLTKIGSPEIAQPEEKNETEKKDRAQNDKLKTIQQIRLEKQRIAARHGKRADIILKRPKREYLAPNTKQSHSAAYLVELIEKINRIGASNFPAEIRNKKLSGKLIADLALNRNGTINRVEVLQSSGSKLLDETAVKFIRMSSPFKPFTDNMIKNDVDIIHITRTYIFTPNSIRSAVADTQFFN